MKRSNKVHSEHFNANFSRWPKKEGRSKTTRPQEAMYFIRIDQVLDTIFQYLNAADISLLVSHGRDNKMPESNHDTYS